MLALGVLFWVAYFFVQSKNLSKKTHNFVDNNRAYDKKILMIGDSIMRGVGTSHSERSLQALVAKHSPESLVTVFAKDGARAREIMIELKKRDKGKYDQVIIFCGGMDIIYFSSDKEISGRLQELFLYAKLLSSNVLYISPANVGHAPLFPFPLSHVYARRSKNFLDISQECAKKHGITFVDYYSTSHSHYACDKSHPDDYGYEKLFSLFKEHVIR